MGAKPVTFWSTGCPSGKRSYETRAAAKQAHRGNPRKKRLQLSVYECPQCGFYHLGTLPKVVVEGTKTREDLQPARTTRRRPPPTLKRLRRSEQPPTLES